MIPFRDEAALRSAFSAARSLEPTDAEVMRVLSRTRRPARSTRRLLRAVPALGATVVLLGVGGYAAAPPIRAAVDGVTGTFSDWLTGNKDTVPGRPLAPGEAAPDYLFDPNFGGHPHVLAQAGGYKLFVGRAHDGELEVDLGGKGVGMGFPAGERFGTQPLFVLGPGLPHADAHGHVPLFGLTGRAVESVELRYESGPPLRVEELRGGFVLLAEPRRGPREVVAFDASGAEVGHALVDHSPHPGPRIDWSRY